MPATERGITYPCLTDVLSADVFASHAFTSEAALSSVSTVVARNLDRPSAYVFTATTLLTQGVTHTWNFSGEAWDTDNMFTTTTPGQITVQTAGSYWVTYEISPLQINHTSMRIASRLSGVEFAWMKIGATGGSTTQYAATGLALNAAVGNALTFTALYTGGSATMNVFANIQLFRIAS